MRVTEAELEEYGRRLRSDLPNLTIGGRDYLLSLHIVNKLLGKQWVQAIVDPGARSDAFIGALYHQGIDYVIHHARLIELAETIFNLQEVPGFLDDRLTALRRNRDGVEAANFELWAGRRFKKAGIPFEYVRGRRLGEDYEIDFHVAGQTYPLEVKLKREATVCSENTVRNSLREARLQLPKGRPGVVLLGIPETWLALITNHELVRRAVRETLRNTSRIAAVLVIWRESVLSPTGGLIVVRSSTALNERVTLPTAVKVLLQEYRVDPNASWTTLRSIVLRT